ncbi:FecR family protein, partial [Nisaea nitritireducens]|uniref:FecR family protein n=1 Tax=Nisaea nitritireducens TaxID=568392 RepID=UPI0018672D86
MSSNVVQAQQNENWTILEISGNVEIDRNGSGLAPVSVDSRIGVGSVIRTRDRGRLVLVRGEESIIVGPHTEISIPEQDKSWGTRILQSLGTALFKVKKQSSPHFEVVTPYLAAVVKGTSFTVNVRDGESLVHVVEGAVQVTDTASGAAVMVRPGQTARTTSRSGLQLDSVPVDSGAGATQTDSAAVDESGTSDVALNETAGAGVEGVTSALAAEEPSNSVLSAPVGLTTIDVSSATNGLVRNATASGGRGVAKSSSNNNANNNGRGNGGVSARPAVEVARVSDRSATARSSSRAATRTALVSANSRGNSGNNGNGNGNSGNNGNGNGNSGNNGNGNGNSGNNG